MEIQKSQKIPFKYNCQRCYYGCSSKKDFAKHELTRKHLMEMNGTKWKPENPQCICDGCGRKYQTKSGLWKHKSKCDVQDNRVVKYDPNATADVSDKHIQNNNQNEIINRLMEQNSILLTTTQEFKQLMIDQNN